MARTKERAMMVLSPAAMVSWVLGLRGQERVTVTVTVRGGG